MGAKRYRVEFHPAAAKFLEKLDRPIRARILDRIEELAEDPRPSGVKALQGDDSGFLRIRIGDYRAVYAVRDDVLVVFVVRVAHRRDVYR